MKKLLTTIFATGLFAFSLSASATVFDFVELVDTGTGTIDGDLANGTAFSGNPSENGFDFFEWAKDGMILDVSAYRDDGVNGGVAYAYLDGDWGGNGAGLGVCTVTDALTNQCTPSSDDNVTHGEVLSLWFREDVAGFVDKIVSIDFNLVTFRDASHNVFDPMIEVNLDYAGWSALDLTSTLTASVFDFRLNPAAESTNQFYIDTLNVNAVPAPAGLALFGLGLLALGMQRRKRM